VGAEIFLGGCLEKKRFQELDFFSGFGTGFLKPRFLRLEKILGGMRNI